MTGEVATAVQSNAALSRGVSGLVSPHEITKKSHLCFDESAVGCWRNCEPMASQRQTAEGAGGMPQAAGGSASMAGVQHLHASPINPHLHQH